jgi:uncharacterized protein YkwD
MGGGVRRNICAAGTLTRCIGFNVLMKLGKSTSLFAIILFCGMGSGFGAGPPAMSSRQKQLLDLVNAERAKAGLAQLHWDDHLAQAARVHTKRMVERGELSHQFSGEPPLAQRAGDAGAHFDFVAENVAYAPDVLRLHDDLMHSPHHRANILDAKSNAIGIAFGERDGELYATEDFAHLLGSYTAAQFREQLLADFNRLRRSHGLAAMAASTDPRLEAAACKATLNPQKVIRELPGATNLAMFTASEPDDFPASMKSAAGDKSLHRMSIGVCFKPDPKAGFSMYWVAAAFYSAR